MLLYPATVVAQPLLYIYSDMSCVITTTGDDECHKNKPNAILSNQRGQGSKPDWAGAADSSSLLFPR